MIDKNTIDLITDITAEVMQVKYPQYPRTGRTTFAVPEDKQEEINKEMNTIFMKVADLFDL